MTEPVPTAITSNPKPEPCAETANWLALVGQNKCAILAALQQAGVSRVVVSFDGYGDEGQIESIIAYVNDEMVDMPELQVEVHDIPWRIPDVSAVPVAPCGLRDAIEQLAYDMLGHYEGGWQDNDGAYGELILDVGDNSVTLAFNARFTDSVYSEHGI